MSKEKKIISLVAFLLMLVSFVALFWIVVISQEKTYVSYISQTIEFEHLTDGDKVYYYWSDSKTEDELLYVDCTEDVAGESIKLTYALANNKPQTIYLYFKKQIKGTTSKSVYKTKNYINKEMDITFFNPKIVSKESSNIKAIINSNGYSKVKTIFLQLSENAFSVETNKELLQYRMIGVYDGKNLKSCNLTVDMSGYNIGDGRYYLKITTMDSAGKETIIYSELTTIDFDVINQSVQFSTPTIGPDGQLIPSSNVFLTGDTLVRFEVSGLTASDQVITSMANLEFYGPLVDVSKISIRRFNNDIVSDIKLIPTEIQNNFKVQSVVGVTNEWYYIYYDGRFSGVFLYQLNRVS